MKIGRFAVFAVVLAGMLVIPPPTSAAVSGSVSVSVPASAPASALADPNIDELRKLTKQAAKLNDLYRGQIQSLEELRVQAKKATDDSGSLDTKLSGAQLDVSRLAAAAYMTGPIDGTRLFSSGIDPTKMLGQAANMAYLADDRANKVNKIQTLIDESEQAKRTAAAKVAKMKREIKTMQGKRREMERLLAKYGFQQPGGAEGLTPRMISVRAAIMQNFPMPYGVGCLRNGDPGEHGKGRACDFMMATGGRAASGADEDRGDALAEWLIQNGARIGVMYIIWKQRYYDIRSSGGWDPMSDRGGITANHYDHVHVSVF